MDAPAAYVTSVEVLVRREAANSGADLSVTLVAGDEGGLPSGVVLGDTELPAGAISTSELVWVTAVFDPPVQLGPEENWVVLRAQAAATSSGYWIPLYNVGTGGHLALLAGSRGQWSLLSKPYNLPNRVFGSLTPPVQDSDGDGVPDDQDAYPNSDLSPTLIVGGADLGIPNQSLGDGASMGDVLAAALNGAATPGEAQRNAAAVLNGWKAQGLITGRDQGRIASAIGGR